MQVSNFFSAGLIVIIFSGCGRSDAGEQEFNKMADSTAAIISSPAAVEDGKDTTRKFIRTADLKFKVKSVIHATYDIENITGRQGGFVTYTNLASQVDEVTTIPVSADSSLETTYYTVTNTITLRVPNTRLDSTLKQIAHNIDYLDYRIIKADDVAIQLLSNNLAQKRSAKTGERLAKAIDNRAKKLTETTDAEKALEDKQEEADNAWLSSLSLSDQVKFSTINISIYQRQAIKRELISNDQNIEAYEPGFGSKMLESVQTGWNMLEAFLVFLARLWAFIMVVLLAFILYKKYGRKLK